MKSLLTLQTVLNHYNLSPDKNHRLNCPWHPDKTPSLQIFPKTNTWTCFSSNCKAGSGDQIEFIHKMEKLKNGTSTKHQALKLATKLSGGEEDKTLTSTFHELQQKLQRSKVARTYLANRNLNPIKIQAGYNSYKSDFKQLKNCIVFPLKDKNGNIISMYGRSITDKNSSKHYYLKNRKGLYPAYPKPETKTIIITEAIIDAATIITHTEHEVLSMFGTNGWNEEHSEVVKTLENLEEIIFFVDGDEAGKKSIATYMAIIRVLRPTVKISSVNTPDGEDVNSLVIGHEVEILEHLIKEREFLFSSESTLPSDEEKEENYPSPELFVPTKSELKNAVKRLVEESEKSSKPKVDIPAKLLPPKLDTSNPEFMTMLHGELVFTVMGGLSMYPLDRLKITLKIEKVGSRKALHRLRQTIDLYQDDLVEKLARKVAERLEMGSTKVHESLLELTESLEAFRKGQLEEKQIKPIQKRILSEGQQKKAIQFLKSKNLLKRTNEAIGKSGVMGEKVNRILMFLVFTSRLRNRPLHIISLGGSGTGKTYLQEKISELIPESDKLEITTISENALYYFDRKELQHKLVLVEDLDGANDDKVLFAIRELQSKRRISKTIPIKDSKGNLKTITLQVEGPISLAGTTTRESLYEDNANRSLLIYLDTSQTHKEKIMDYQRKLSAGKINQKQEGEIREFMKDVQSVLKNIRVVNPYAELLNLPQSVFKPLRTNSHYLHFIETVTFYHQHQRELKTDENGMAFIETTLEDIERANELLKEVLLAKSDELTKACRRFLELLKRYLKEAGKDSFFTKEIRKKYRVSPVMVKRRLYVLVQYGYVKIVSGSQSRGYEYELDEAGEKLREELENAFEATLKKIKLQNKKNLGGSVGQ